MKSNNELFGEGIDVPEFDPLIIARRIELLRDRLEDLLNHSYHTRDNNLVGAVLKAIRWHENINKMGEGI